VYVFEFEIPRILGLSLGWVPRISNSFSNRTIAVVKQLYALIRCARIVGHRKCFHWKLHNLLFQWGEISQLKMCRQRLKSLGLTPDPLIPAESLTIPCGSVVLFIWNVCL